MTEVLGQRIDEAYAECVRATREFVMRVTGGTGECVLGLSGGIDSGLVAVIAAEALGAEKVHCVLLPGPHSTKHSIDDALELARRQGLSTLTVPIEEPVAAFERILAQACAPDAPTSTGASTSTEASAFSAFAPTSTDASASTGASASAFTPCHLTGITAQNVQARTRMVCLMALSNAHGWLMLNTGNRSEAFMGYSTLYGDMAGAFAPIGGLWKTQVFAMARWLNERAAAEGVQPPIPQHMIDKPPSAELAEDQTDEDSLGITYALLDQILAAHVDGEASREELCAQGFALRDVDLVLHRIAGSAFKRPLLPPHPQCGSRAAHTAEPIQDV